MKYDYFIASRWRNKTEVLELTDKIRAAGKTIYCFIEGDGSHYELKDLEEQFAPDEFMNRFESIPNWRTDPKVREIFDVDMNAMRKSQHVILLLPAGISAHIEAGVAYGLGKELSVIGEQHETESLYLIFNHFYTTIDDFITTLDT